MRQWLSKGSLLGRFFFQTIGAFLLVMGFGGWVAWFGLRGTEPARAEEALGRMGLSRCARGGGWFASKARSGPVPLPPWGWVGRWAGAWGGSWVVASQFLGWAAILRADEVEGDGVGS
jgi:hypothetical protein